MNNNSRKYKHGAAAVLITAGVLAAVLILNIAFTLLSNRFLFYIDVTKEKYNEICGESKALLDKLDPDENNITIYFLADTDELDDPSLGYLKKNTGSMWGMKYVYELALQYAASYSFIKIGFLNLKSDQEILSTYRSTVGVTFSKTNVIVDNYTGETDINGNYVKGEDGKVIMHHNYRIIERDNFFRANEDTSYAYAFDGDYRFTSVILSLAGRNPTVYFTTGHGEATGGSDPSDYGEAQALRDLFFDSGFVTRKIDLAKDYTALFEDESARVVIVYGPKTDFSGYGDPVNELSLLHKFAVTANHNLMFFLDPENGSDLGNLKEYIYDYCGVAITDEKVRDVGTGGISDDGYSFIASYETDTYSVGASLIKSLTELDSQPAAAFSNASVLEINDKYVQTPSNASSGFYENAASTTTGAIFLTPPTSVSVDKEGNTVTDYSENGLQPVMALTYESWLNTKNSTTSTYALVCGSTAFASARYLEDPSYGNASVLTLAMRLMGKEIIPFEIDFKVIQSEAVDIDSSEARTWTIVLCSLVPLASLTMGAVVFLKRRHQ